MWLHWSADGANQMCSWSNSFATAPTLSMVHLWANPLWMCLCPLCHWTFTLSTTLLQLQWSSKSLLSVLQLLSTFQRGPTMLVVLLVVTLLTKHLLNVCPLTTASQSRRQFLLDHSALSFIVALSNMYWLTQMIENRFKDYCFAIWC